ncbi:hypothetical protein [Marichromatium sp. AB32]|uniref:hypothetical protein n=1 Tax=Marichromatium sp. AB32 TaxID=2483363 RepID=UPI000F3ED83D|nr:hypothetical protein [Marichromatium sp. AB32]RNE92611.1 hypothetical protein EBL85_11180 [Marichromatium sp. AB32]
MSDSLTLASQVAADVYQALMTEVVEPFVLKDRKGHVLDQKKQRDLSAGKIIDTRVVHLMSISGKGGYDPDPVKNARYAESANITLLDHLLSVTRGALIFAALDILERTPDIDLDGLRAELRILAALAFMHDVDKDLCLPRGTLLSLEAIAERWARYGLDQFTGDALTADQVRFLIEHVETTQAHRSPPAEYPPRRFSSLMRYVALADKLDGLWLKEGIDAVLERLRKDGALDSDLLRHWTLIDLFDPHHPFLVDELQRALSACCKPVPPLIEGHQDGRLVMLVPAAQANEIRDTAIRKVRRFLGRKLFGLRINVSNRGLPEILDSQPDHEQLTNFLSSKLKGRDLAALFRVKSTLANEVITRELDGLLGCIGLEPNWPKGQGQTITPYPNPEALSGNAQHALRSAAHLALLLNYKAVKQLPSYDAREQAVLDVIGEERPAWLSAIEDAASRRTFTSLWATQRATTNPDLYADIWGTGGLLHHWLEGTDDQPGLRDSILAQGEDRLDAVVSHFAERLDNKRMAAPSNQGKRCLITDMPVRKDATFKDSDKLYEVKKSAFSGRDGRLENIDSATGETHIAPVSYAEHRLRSVVHANAGGRPDGIPTLLSMSSTTGLFAGLVLDNERDFQSLSVFDLAREQVAKGKVYSGLGAYRQRFRVARFERVPVKTEEQTALLRLLLRSALRIGRPLHLFRGLPTNEKAFFAYDAMPRRLADLIGGRRLRIEQVPAAIERLETAQLILDTNGLGFEVFDRYTRPATRLGAICLTWSSLHEAARSGKPDRTLRFKREFEQCIEENSMSDTEAPLVKLGHAAARIQQRPHGSASTNEEMLTFNLCLKTAIGAWRLGQRDPESLAMAVAGELETNLARKNKIASAKNRPEETLADAFLSFAQLFVDDVWFGVMQGRPPAQSSRRILGSIYRMSFLTAPRPKSEATDAPAAANS